METIPPTSRHDSEGRERYMLIHKIPVGPKTAERLFLLYEELSQHQEPATLYKAGWAAAESGLVGTHLSPDERSSRICAAQSCWEYALTLEQERAANSAWITDKPPARTEELHIATALASIPVLVEIPYGKPSKPAVRMAHTGLLQVARQNVDEMLLAKKHYGREGRSSNHRGLGYEHLTQLSISRMLSARIVPIASFARSASGAHYPSQTHDVQFLNLDRGNIMSVTPIEVKSKLKNRVYKRYQDVGLVAGYELIERGETALSQAIELFEQEALGTATPDEIGVLAEMTDSVIHSIRHFRRPERYGKHCLGALRCELKTAA